MKSWTLALLLVPSLALSTTTARADAIVRSQAMLAGTIAEFFVTDEYNAVELEIGLEDLAGFRNLLRDLGSWPRLWESPVRISPPLFRYLRPCSFMN